MHGIGLKMRFRPDARYGVISRIGFYRYNLVNNLDANNQPLIEQQSTITGLSSAARIQRDKYYCIMQYELSTWAS